MRKMQSVMMFLFAKENRQFAGYELLQTVLAAGFVLERAIVSSPPISQWCRGLFYAVWLQQQQQEFLICKI